MLREVIAFANFEFSLHTVMSKVLAGERIQVEERRLINWQEYQIFLENLGLDGNWEGRNFWRLYRLPQADSSTFDELRCFQGEIVELLEAIAEHRVIPGRYWQKIFRECDGLPMFVRPAQTSLADHYGPAEVGGVNFHYSFQADTYQAFIMALLRQLIIGGRIFAIVKDENGLFAARSGGVEAARDNGARLDSPDCSSPGGCRATTLTAAEEALWPRTGLAPHKETRLEPGGPIDDSSINDGPAVEIAGPDGTVRAAEDAQASKWGGTTLAEESVASGFSLSDFEAAPGGSEPAFSPENNRAVERGGGFFLNPSAADSGLSAEAEPPGAAPLKAQDQDADESWPRPLNDAAAESGPKGPNWFRIPVEYIVDNLDRLKSGRGGWPPPCVRELPTESKD